MRKQEITNNFVAYFQYNKYYIIYQRVDSPIRLNFFFRNVTLIAKTIDNFQRVPNSCVLVEQQKRATIDEFPSNILEYLLLHFLFEKLLLLLSRVRVRTWTQ